MNGPSVLALDLRVQLQTLGARVKRSRHKVQDLNYQFKYCFETSTIGGSIPRLKSHGRPF